MLAAETLRRIGCQQELWLPRVRYELGEALHTSYSTWCEQMPAQMHVLFKLTWSNEKQTMLTM